MSIVQVREREKGELKDIKRRLVRQDDWKRVSGKKKK